MNFDRREKMRFRAQHKVKRAIERGDIKALDGTVKCTDCDAPAFCYDHRDYNYPLLAEPVCKGCNTRRGPGLPYVDDKDNTIHKGRLEGGEGTEGLPEYHCYISLAEFNPDPFSFESTWGRKDLAEKWAQRYLWRHPARYKDGSK